MFNSDSYLLKTTSAPHPVHKRSGAVVQDLYYITAWCENTLDHSIRALTSPRSLLVWPTACACVAGSVPTLIVSPQRSFAPASSSSSLILPIPQSLFPASLSSALCHCVHLFLITPPPSLSLLPPFIPLLAPPSSPRLGSGAVNRCCLLLIWVRSD